jgi:hypothetical protein
VYPNQEPAVSISRSSIPSAHVALTFILCAAAAACHDDVAAPHPISDHAIAVTYCAAAAPLWVAFQDGDGAWTRALPEASGGNVAFRHEFTSNRGAVATVVPIIDGEFTLLQVLYGAPAELTTFGDTSRAGCEGTSAKTLRGSVVGLGVNDHAQISLGDQARAFVEPQLGTDFSLEGVQPGPQDLFATRTIRSPDVADRLQLILRRNIDLPDGAQIPALDFGSAEAFDAATANVTVPSAVLPAVNTSALRTSNGEFVLPFLVDQATNAQTRPYLAVPESKLQAGDVQQLHVSTTTEDVRTVDVFFRAPIDRTIQFGAPIIVPTLSAIGTGPALRLRAHFVPQADYDQLTAMVYEQPSLTTFLIVSMTPRYSELVGGYDIDVPDLLPVPGFDPAWTLSPDAVVTWTATRVGGTLPQGRGVTPTDGAVRRTTVRQDVFNVR